MILTPLPYWILPLLGLGCGVGIALMAAVLSLFPTLWAYFILAMGESLVVSEMLRAKNHDAAVRVEDMCIQVSDRTSGYLFGWDQGRMMATGISIFSSMPFLFAYISVLSKLAGILCVLGLWGAVIFGYARVFRKRRFLQKVPMGSICDATVIINRRGLRVLRLITRSGDFSIPLRGDVRRLEQEVNALDVAKEHLGEHLENEQGHIESAD